MKSFGTMSDRKGGSDGSFESRLKAARAKQGMDPDPAAQADGAKQNSAMSVGLRVGVEMVSALAVGTGIGFALDRWLHMSPLFLVLFVLLGGAAGVANVWRVLTPRPSRSLDK
jgi:ATP synthase protein I